MADRDEVLETLREQEAETARGDVADVLAAMADDVGAYDIPPPLASAGAAAFDVDDLKSWFETWEDGVTAVLFASVVLVEGEFVATFGPSQIRGIRRSQGPLDSWSRCTVALRREVGACLVHDRGSYPRFMDGGCLAATDLRPEAGSA